MIQDPKPRVCVGIVTYNSAADINRCLASLFAQTLAATEIVVLDNQSQDATWELLQPWVERGVRVHASGENLGFGRGHNWILRHAAPADYYLCLNPDMELDPRFLEHGLNTFAQAPANVGAVNGLVCYLNPQGEHTQIVFTRGHHFYAERRTESIDIGAHVSELELSPEYVFGPNGCAPLLRMEAIRDVALPSGELYEPRFFMYSEDEDLGWRLGLHGWRTLFTPEALGWHKAGGSNPSSVSRVRADSIANRYLTVLRNDHWISLARSLPAILLVESSFVILNGLRRPRFWVDYAVAWLKVLREAPHFLAARKHVKVRLNPWERHALLKPFDRERLRTLFGRHARRVNPHSIHTR